MKSLKKITEIMRGNILILFISWIFLDFGGYLVEKFEPVYYSYLGADSIIMGYLFFLYFGTQSILQVISGAWADTIGRKKIITTLTFFYSSTILIFALAPDWRFIALAIVLSNLSLIYQPALWAIIMDSLPKEKRASGFAITYLPLIPALIAPFIAGYFLHEMQIQHGEISGFILGMRILFGIYFLLALTASIVRLKLKETIKIRKRENITSAFVDGIRIWKKVNKNAKYVLYGEIVLGFVNGLTVPFYAIYAMEYMKLNPSLWGAIATIEISIASTLGIPMGMLADKYGKIYFFILGNFILPVEAYLFILGGSFFFIWGVLSGLTMAVVAPSFSGLLADYVPSEKRGRVMGSFQFFIGISAMLGAFISGYIYNFNHQLNFILLSITALIISIYYLFKIK